MTASSVLTDLHEREQIAQVSDLSALDDHLTTAPRVVYSGFDPTAPSLHIGNLVPLLALKRFQEHGHRPIVLIGGATGLIGDPSGKEAERALNTRERVSEWVALCKEQVFKYFDDSGSNALKVVDNLEWSEDFKLVDFLRDIGKYFSVNAMVQRDSVRTRLEREGSGISFTEFSYMLLQANDYLELARRHDCSIQIGGSDQWGNIVSGSDLVRRALQRPAYALTLKLLTKNDGSKFGKTAAGTVWLDAELTSPYSFYQYWFNIADSEIGNALHTFSAKTTSERTELIAQSLERPEARLAQKAIAQELTRLVHGESALQATQRITDALFGGSIADLTMTDLGQLWQDGLARAELSDNVPLSVALCDTKLAQSRSAARRLLDSGGVSVNGTPVKDVNFELHRADALFGEFHLLRRGRKSWGIARHLS
ncbi:MAG: tyrosine--tRNA ligase [Gammaproteobacteria bacterium]|nr:tyrosine--tRNA ligase [Gammaproteobacteria bacterium]